MAVFLLAKAALGIHAVSHYRHASDRAAEIVLGRVIEAKWASLNTWHVFDRTANTCACGVPARAALEPTVQSGDRRIACALWFGGELDSDGRARLEVVKVGGFTQTRAPTE